MGRYVELEEIGRGGMGRVQRAYDPKLQREVALKEVRGDMLGPAGALRLVAEARAMAKLSHPNVVAIYDVEEAGAEQVVLVMEYVAGESLTAWLQQPRSWRDIIVHFRRAGRGLAAAHAAGLLHRDFKPDNVLVGSDGRVRVTDFGLAREMHFAPTDEAVAATSSSTVGDGLTASGTIVGTLAYLAPERLMGAQADAATDQFAFCVALWEALYRERPFVGQSAFELAFAMAAGPPRPPAGGPRLPARVSDAILRGLAADPRLRWPDMHELLGALAYDPSRRRRRGLQLVAGAAVLAIGVVGVQAWASARAERCSEANAVTHLHGAWDDTRRGEVEAAMLGIETTFASDAWTRTQSLLDDYATAWSQLHVEICTATTVRGEQSEAVMDLRMGCLQRARVELAAVAQVLAEADAQTVQKAHELVATLRPLVRCNDVAALQADVEPPLPEQVEAVDSVRAELALTRAELSAGRLDAAERGLSAAQDAVSGLDYAPLATELALLRGHVREVTGDYDDALAAFRDALRLAAAARQPDELQVAASELVYVLGNDFERFDEALRFADLAYALTEGDPLREADVANHVAIVLEAQGKHVEAEALLRRALALREEVLGVDDIAFAGTLEHLASMLTAQGKHVEAEATHRRALALQEQHLGPEHPRVATTRNNLAADLHAQGKLGDAEAEHRKVFALRQRVLGPDHPDLAQSRNNLAAVLYAQKKLPEAEAEFRAALAFRERTLGEDHPLVAESRLNLAAILNAEGRQLEAEQQMRRALVQQIAQLGEHPTVALAHHNLAVILGSQRKYTEAAAEYRLALELREKLLGVDDPETGVTHNGIANTLEAVGELAQAKAEHRRALAIWEEKLGHEHPFVGMTQVNLARVLLGLGENAEARRLAEAAWTRFAKEDIEPSWRPEAAFVLARTCWAGGTRADTKRALELAETALAGYVALGSGDTAEANDVKTWIAGRKPR